MYQPFYRKAVAVTPDNATAISPRGVRGLSVTTAGNYTILLEGDASAVTMNLVAGVIHPLAVARVNSTGAASVNGIVAFY